MKEIAAKRFPDAYPEAVTKVISNGQKPVWQSDPQKFINPERDVIFAWAIDGQGEKSFRCFRVTTTDLSKLLQKHLKENPRLELINGKVDDHNSKHKYTPLHVSFADLDEMLGLTAQRLEE
jgi:hypothetical protein